ncbi:MAG: shikimate dehydrogenase [Methylotenera sp.]
MTDKYAVIGHPIAHSKSPEIHSSFAVQTNQNIEYEAIEAPIDGFQQIVAELMARGYRGVNVTVPFKFEAFQLANQLRMHAKQAGTVNTLLFSDGNIIGDNTDGIGLVRDIEQNLHKSILSKRVLILGAGGAAEGVLHPILNAAPSRLEIANRSVAKAVAMVAKVKDLVQYRSVGFAACAFQDLKGRKFDIVINATSAGLQDARLPIPDDIFADGCLAYDMMYGKETPFMSQAREAGATVVDGLGMLVEQAAEAFYCWRNVRPQTGPVIEKLRV